MLRTFAKVYFFLEELLRLFVAFERGVNFNYTSRN